MRVRADLVADHRAAAGAKHRAKGSRAGLGHLAADNTACDGAEDRAGIGRTVVGGLAAAPVAFIPDRADVVMVVMANGMRRRRPWNRREGDERYQYGFHGNLRAVEPPAINELLGVRFHAKGDS